MGASIIFSTIVINMKPHDSAALFNRFKIQPKPKYFLQIIQWKVQVCFSIYQLIEISPSDKGKGTSAIALIVDIFGFAPEVVRKLSESGFAGFCKPDSGGNLIPLQMLRKTEMGRTKQK